MAVQPQRTSWPDERLDDLNQVIREGFARNEREMNRLRSEVNARFDHVEDRFDRTDARFDGLIDKFDALQRVMIVGLFSVCGAILAAVVASLLA